MLVRFPARRTMKPSSSSLPFVSAGILAAAAVVVLVGSAATASAVAAVRTAPILAIGSTDMTTTRRRRRNSSSRTRRDDSCPAAFATGRRHTMRLTASSWRHTSPLGVCRASPSLVVSAGSIVRLLGSKPRSSAAVLSAAKGDGKKTGGDGDGGSENGEDGKDDKDDKDDKDEDRGAIEPGDLDAWDTVEDYAGFELTGSSGDGKDLSLDEILDDSITGGNVLGVNNDDDAPSFSSSSSSSWTTPNLGIDIGSRLQPLSPEEAEEFRREATEQIERAFKDRLDEVDDIKRMVAKDFESSRKKLALASDLRAQRQGEELLRKIDSITNDFLDKTRGSRERTKLAYEADLLTGKRGVGVEVGSWGLDRYGRVVLADGEGGYASGKGVLGGVSAAFDRAAREAAAVEEGADEAENLAAVAATKSKVIVISDDRQDPGAKKVLDRFAELLSDAFDDDDVVVERVPSSSPVPLGGLNAQTAIIVASCVGDRANAKSLLDRLLRRTATPGGGSRYGVPPTHLIVLSTLGTERTDKFPYNTQNMLGGKLSKRRDVEEAVIDTVKRRMPGVQAPLDYTIFKIGDVVDDASVKSKGTSPELRIRPGDVLDGQTGIEAAARALLQAAAYQPAARNATLSVAGTVTSTLPIADATWDDAFLRLDGPELLRIDGLAEAIGTSDVNEGEDGTDLDRRYDLLSEYVREWSQMFEGGNAGSTGLTTPVVVRPSQKDPSAAEGARRRSGVRILFKQTNTGAAYKSKDEERAMERDGPARTTSSSSSSQATERRRKSTKEGGVEVLVEATTATKDLRVRARRCNVDDNTVVKELSEAAILKQLEKGIAAWVKEQNELRLG